MFCFIFNLKPVYFTKIGVSLFICVDLYIFSETIASECCTFHTAPHIYGFLYARGQCRTIDRETVYFYILVGPSEFNEPSTRRFALNSISSYRFLSNYTHLTCLNFILTFVNHRNNSKTAPISRYLVRHSLGNPRFCWYPSSVSTLFLAG